MLLKGVIHQEIQNSISQKSCSELLKKHIFNVITEAIESNYEETYGLCLQSTLGIQAILKSFKIDSKVVVGRNLVPGICNYPYEYEWVGYWGKYYHVWLITEFAELVDFSISKFNVHPEHKRFYTIPPIWLSNNEWPNDLLRYTPTTSSDYQLQNSDKEKINILLGSIDWIKASLLEMEINELVPIDIISSQSSFQNYENKWIDAVTSEDFPLNKLPDD